MYVVKKKKRTGEENGRGKGLGGTSGAPVFAEEKGIKCVANAF